MQNDKKEGVDETSIIELMQECAKLGFPITFTVDKWGWFKVIVLQQRFKNKDPIDCFRSAAEMILRVKGVKIE